MFPVARYGSLFLSCLVFGACFGERSFAQQKDVWQQVNNKKQHAANAAQKQKGFIREWVHHIREWGVDDTYEYELSLGGNLQTNGFGGHLRYVHNDGGTNRTIWQLNLGMIKHEKEIRQQRSGEAFRELGPFRPFFLGKVNTIHSLQVGYGKEQVLLPSVIEDNISISGSLVVGMAVALQKPVYLNLIYTDATGDHIRPEKHSAVNREQFLSAHRILGADKWSKGIGEAKVVPGVFIEPALVFQPSKNKTFVQRIYVGGNVSYYAKGLEIMALHKARPFHASFFVALGLGKRW